MKNSHSVKFFLKIELDEFINNGKKKKLSSYFRNN